MSNLEVLRSIPIFAGLDEKQLGTILSVMRSRRVSGNAVILNEGDRGDSLFILASGSVEVTKHPGVVATLPTGGPKEKILVQLDAPQFFGEMGILEDTERSATVSTREECELLEITKADFERLGEIDPKLGYRVTGNIAVVMAERLRRTNVDVVKLTVALSLALGVR
ncbi:MAG: cyclic nucleotide-binding domain-containing protein [Dehalococcoidia bacterium]|nr:cyclic nucleotide-binding domain-containing protein [Dehalococcoidia bacterium]